MVRAKLSYSERSVSIFNNGKFFTEPRNGEVCKLVICGKVRREKVPPLPNKPVLRIFFLFSKVSNKISIILAINIENKSKVLREESSLLVIGD